MADKLDETLQLGIVAHQAGRLPAAGEAYAAVLREAPGHPHANHNMGVLKTSQGRPGEALSFFSAAVEADPETAQFWLSYMDALSRLGDGRSGTSGSRSGSGTWGP